MLLAGNARLPDATASEAADGTPVAARESEAEKTGRATQLPPDEKRKFRESISLAGAAALLGIAGLGGLTILAVMTWGRRLRLAAREPVEATQIDELWYLRHSEAAAEERSENGSDVAPELQPPDAEGDERSES